MLLREYDTLPWKGTINPRPVAEPLQDQAKAPIGVTPSSIRPAHDPELRNIIHPYEEPNPGEPVTVSSLSARASVLCAQAEELTTMLGLAVRAAQLLERTGETRNGLSLPNGILHGSQDTTLPAIDELSCAPNSTGGRVVSRQALQQMVDLAVSISGELSQAISVALETLASGSRHLLDSDRHSRPSADTFSQRPLAPWLRDLAARSSSRHRGSGAISEARPGPDPAGTPLPGDRPDSRPVSVAPLAFAGPRPGSAAVRRPLPPRPTSEAAAGPVEAAVVETRVTLRGPSVFARLLSVRRALAGVPGVLGIVMSRTVPEGAELVVRHLSDLDMASAVSILGSSARVTTTRSGSLVVELGRSR